MSLYDEILAIGAAIGWHESDLHTPDTEWARRAISRHGWRAIPFKCAVTGEPWLDIPFAYDPWWRKKNADKCERVELVKNGGA